MLESLALIYQKVPDFGKAVVVLLALMAIAFGLRAWLDQRSIQRSIQAFLSAIKLAGTLAPNEKERGLTLEAVERMREASTALGDIPKGWWDAIHQEIAPYRSPRQAETFFLARVDGHEVDFSGHTDVERDTVHEYRWWSLDELDSLDATEVRVYPAALGAELRALLGQVLRSGPPLTPKDVGP